MTTATNTSTLRMAGPGSRLCRKAADDGSPLAGHVEVKVGPLAVGKVEGDGDAFLRVRRPDADHSVTGGNDSSAVDRGGCAVRNEDDCLCLLGVSLVHDADALAGGFDAQCARTAAGATPRGL